MNIAEEIRNKIDADVEVEHITVNKNNGVVRKGFCIKKKNEKCAPTIYYDDDMSDEQIIDCVVEVYNNNNNDNAQSLAKEASDIFSSADRIYESVFPALINREKNSEYLKNVVHKGFLDMEIIYKVVLNPFGDFLASVVITNEHIKNFDISLDKLHKSALANIKNIGKITGMFETLMSMKVVPFDGISPENCEEEYMYIVSNETRINGASVILNPDIMMQLHKKLGSDNVIILPSSVHEVIGLSFERGMDKDELRNMVNEVNSTTVSAEEVLSDSVYVHNVVDGWRIVA